MSEPTTGPWGPVYRPGLCAYLTDEELARLHKVTVEAVVQPGGVILHKGAPSRSLLLVESGEIEVVEERMGEAIPVATIRTGEVAGEVGFLDGRTRTHDVRARTLCKVRRLTRDAFISIRATEPVIFAKIVLALAEILAGRFRDIAAELDPIRGFAASLAEPLEVAPAPGPAGEDFEELEMGGEAEAAFKELRHAAARARKGLAGL